MKASAASSIAYDAMPIGLSVDDLEKYYSSFHTVGLAHQCQILKKRIETIKAEHINPSNQDWIAILDAQRRLRIARRLLAKRQLRMFE
jgi:hypothetical protein